MKEIIGRVGPCTLTAHPGSPFKLLIRCIVSQQISTKAARSIFERVMEVAGDPELPIGRLKGFTDEQFRACGLSGPKQRTVRAVIEHVESHPDLLGSLDQHDDDAVRDQLTQIKGIGPWTADMFLIFGILRPDVLPVGDFGFRSAIKKAFRLRDMPEADRCRKIGEAWRPYRSLATWYLWRSLEPQHAAGKK